MFIESWLVLLNTVVVTALCFLTWRQSRQIRCLRFCFIEMSDWAGSKTKEILEDCQSGMSHDEIPDSVVGAFSDWHSEMSDLVGWMKRAGLAAPSERDKRYILAEDD